MDPDCCENPACLTHPSCFVDVLSPEDIIQENETDSDSVSLAFDETVDFIFRNNSIQVGLNESALNRE